MKLKRAMLFSLIMIVAAVTMLFSTSYAWFIDSQEIDNNAVAAGTLDVSLSAVKANGTVIDLTTNPAINETNWQPSDWNAVAITVTNNGTLDMKFDLDLSIVSSAPYTDLSPVIWYVLTPNASLPTAGAPYTRIAEPASPVFMNNFAGVTGVTLAAGQSITYKLDYGFLKTAGNEYQGGKLTANISVEAYQTMAD